jgi:ubiquinone biosynthesis monooxygenase Coq6
MVENLNLTSALLRRLDELGGVDAFDGARVEGIDFGEDTPEMDMSQWPVVSLAGGKRLWARLLVGADGANSPVRSFAGIEARGWDYERHGVVATLRLMHTGLPVGGGIETAYQRFLPTGPVAALPMPHNHATLVWSTTPENAAVLKALAPADFVAMVNAAFTLSPTDLAYMHTQASGQADELKWRLDHTTTPDDDPHGNPWALPLPVAAVQEGTVASFPLKMRHADSYIGERVALVGDAAHTVHPLAGQGLNAGQADVESLSRALAGAVARGQDIGSRLSLEPYESERYAANHVMLGVCDKLHKLYSVGSGPIVGLRSLGLRAVDASRPLKDFLMRQAAGNGFKIL